jgi:hypothetical protein
MQVDDAVLIAPPVGIAAGVASYFVFGTSASTSVLIATAIGLSPFALMAVLVSVVVVFFGGLNNDRPPCPCGECKSNDYEYDDAMTRERNPTRAISEWVYRCPKCGRTWLSRDNVFYELHDDCMIAYRKQTRWGRWVTVK